MSKERRAVSLDPEVDAFLAREEVNASGLVNDLVRRHMNGDTGTDALRELRREQLKSEIESYEKQAEQKREELETLNKVESEAEQEQAAKLQDAIERCEGLPRDPDNPGIKTQAAKVGMDPEEFVDELPDRDDGGLRSV